MMVIKIEILKKAALQFIVRNCVVDELIIDYYKFYSISHESILSNKLFIKIV